MKPASKKLRDLAETAVVSDAPNQKSSCDELATALDEACGQVSEAELAVAPCLRAVSAGHSASTHPITDTPQPRHQIGSARCGP